MYLLSESRKFLENGMEEGDHFVEQSVEAEARGEVPALQNVSGSATPAPHQAPQFPTQFAQQMAAFFQ